MSSTTTAILEDPSITIAPYNEEVKPLEPTTIDLTEYPKLSPSQLGHIRHIYNLASQPPNSWNHMGGSEGQQEWVDAYRYQLATMLYTLSLAHYHHQPILRSVYKPVIRALIFKMLLRSVWGYWFNTSLGGRLCDPDLEKLREPWADPVVRENIMYSGHLLLMISLYGMLFDDDEFEKEVSIGFHWNPLFFGLGSERFEYSNSTLQAAVLREMERTGYLGACCEPNVVFVVCNQFPIIAMRLRDVRNGTNVVDDFLQKYRAAWEAKGMTGENGLFVAWWMEKQNCLVPSVDVADTAWAGAFMNAWNGEFVREGFEKHSLGFLTTFDGQVRLQTPDVANAIRGLVREGADLEDVATLEKAKAQAIEAAKNPQPTPFTYNKPVFGYVTQWLSELGKVDLLNGLLDYADKHLKPTWENGGLYYPRNDLPHDTDWNYTAMEPYTGNAAIAYARLNVEDGQKKMYEEPWTKEDLATRPYVDGVQLADGVDFVRGVWDPARQAMVLTMRSWDGQARMVKPVFRNLSVGLWELSVDGKLHSTSGGEDTGCEIVVGAADVDIVLAKCG